MKQSICSLTQVIRSKNAGPYELVLDILFKTQEDYQRVKVSEQLTPQLIASLYNVNPDFIHRIIWFDPANAVKNCHATGYYFRQRGRQRCLWRATTCAPTRYFVRSVVINITTSIGVQDSAVTSYS
ncbi:Uncharacterised protein [Salmonella enterica subsp. arizonae]|uniref:DUF4387 domain-containing protein n=1 Tax=Salmonella enterica subsp. arizonae TaxID=59203 RepID=A0A379TF57_SALER|nr:Uncharacterised protein [Salmonella enterica subsp. arizonae]